MNFKKYKPTTSSQRHLILLHKLFLNKSPMIKSKIVGILKSSGRNHSGKITIRHKGGGNKQKYRKIDFERNCDTNGIVTSLEYDPNRTAYIASVYDLTQEIYYYMIAPINLTLGDIIKSGLNTSVKLGHTLNFNSIPVGSFIHCISLGLKKKAQFTRSAGTFSILIEKTRNYCRIKLSSGEQRLVRANTSSATLGIVSNKNNFLKVLGKAGRSRWLNNRPKVRGVAMNPIDHPHGGGEGKTSGGRTSVTPWGKPTKNKMTSRSNKLILLSRKFKK